MPKDLILDELKPLTQPEPEQKAPSCENKKDKKAQSTEIFYGVWDKSETNEPVAYFALDKKELGEQFAFAAFGEGNYLIAKVMLPSRPLITRSNLGGAKNIIIALLAQENTVAES